MKVWCRTGQRRRGGVGQSRRAASGKVASDRTASEKTASERTASEKTVSYRPDVAQEGVGLRHKAGLGSGFWRNCERLDLIGNGHGCCAGGAQRVLFETN